MSLDVASIKQKDANGGSYQKPLSQGTIAALGGFTVSFTTLLKRASARIETGFDLLSQRSGIAGVPERPDLAERQEAPAADRRADRGERADDRSRGDRNDDRQRVKGSDRRDERDGAPADRRRDDTVDAADDRDDGALDRNHGSVRSDKASKKDSNRAAKSTDESGQDDDACTDCADTGAAVVAGNGESQQPATPVANPDSTTALLGNGRQNAELLLQGLIAAFQSGQLPPQANKQVLGDWLSDSNRKSAIDALTTSWKAASSSRIGARRHSESDMRSRATGPAPACLGS